MVSFDGIGGLIKSLAPSITKYAPSIIQTLAPQPSVQAAEQATRQQYAGQGAQGGLSRTQQLSIVGAGLLGVGAAAYGVQRYRSRKRSRSRRGRYY